MRHSRLFLIILLSILLQSCAIQVPPGGGEKDIEPPKLVSSDPVNYSTNFNRKDIRLDFDEYIALNEINSQLIVSPLLAHQPECKIKKKSILIHIEDTLLENTTYTMNFGKGIMDNNEGNKFENFQFVFSTGPIIDSLTISGNVKQAFDLKTEKGILVMLYKGHDDSLPFLDRPIYFTRTEESGDYTIKNISPGAYKLIGLQETDGNYIYTPGEELIGYADSLIEANSTRIDFTIFKENLKPGLLRTYSEFPGKVVLAFNTAADSLPWIWLSDTSQMKIHTIDYSEKRDTAIIWYKNVEADSLSIRFDNNYSMDTITLRLFKASSTNIKSKKSNVLSVSTARNQTNLQHLWLPHYLELNHPAITFDLDKLILKEDSLPVKTKIIFTDSLHTKISVIYPWKSKTQYSLYIPPATFKDIFGLENDTTLISFESHNETDYGSVKLNFKNTDNSKYTIQLVDENGVKSFREIETSKDTTHLFGFLDPGSYRIKLIRDANKNGRWDTGNYLQHHQPELIEFYPEKINVRANWDVDVTVQPQKQ